MTRAARHRLLLCGAILALVVLYGVVTPIGEAPDEPAHLHYVDAVLRDGPLPRPDPASSPFFYELHQPPLEYWTAALALRAVGLRRLERPFHANPETRSGPEPRRAFLAPAGGDRLEAAHLARAAALPWVAVTVMAVLLVPAALGHEGRAVAPLLFLLSPQLLFHAATFHNDHAAVALASLATLGALRLTRDGASPRPALGTGLAGGLALLAKASGLTAAAPLAVAALDALRRRLHRSAALLACGFGVGALAYVALQVQRLGTAWPLAGGTPRPIAEALTVKWSGTVWASFWGKLGWLRIPLPIPLYAWFLLPSFLVVLGFAAGFAPRAPASGSVTPRRSAWWILVATGAANLLLLVLYQLRIDYQPQGRYLFPALIAWVGLATLGEARLRAAWPPLGRILDWAPTAAFAVALVGAWAVLAAR